MALARPAFRPQIQALEDRVTPAGFPSLATGAAPGQQPEVRVYDFDGTELTRFLAYDADFTGGVNVAVGDVTGDDVADIITAPKAGGGSNVRVFDGTTFSLVQSFYAFDPSFTGGVSLATANVTADEPFSTGHDIVVGAGAGGGPRVAVFRGSTGELVKSFYAFDPNFRGGVNVAATSGGWITPAGVGLAIFVASPPVWLEGTIVVGAGVGGAPHVKQFGADTLGLRQSFYAYDFGFRGGVDVAVTQGYFAVKAGTVTDHAADGSPISYPYLTGTMIVTGAGDGGGPHVKVFFHPGTDTPTGLSEVASFNGGSSDGRHGVSVGLRGSEVLTTTRLSDGGVRTESHSFQFAGEQPAILTETPFGNTLANSGTFGSIPKAIQFPPLKVEVTGVAIPVQPEAL